MSDPTFRDGRSEGFSLVELLIVVAIIAIMAAVSLPMISNYLKFYKLRGATQQVTGEIQAARNKAISKNVNLGVVFVTLDDRRYRWIVEDDQIVIDGISPIRRTLAALIGDTNPDNVRAQAGPEGVLPNGLTFSQTCPAPAPTGGAWEAGFRFNRLGAWCSPDTGDANCPPLDIGQAFVFNTTTGGTGGDTTSGAVICVVETSSGLRRRIDVRPGGRVVSAK